LRRHACINWRLPGRDGISRWEFEKKGKKVEIVVEGPLIANHQDVGVAAALQGLGILYAYDDDGVGPAIEQGRLERILADWSPVRPGLYLYYSNRHHPQPGRQSARQLRPVLWKQAHRPKRQLRLQHRRANAAKRHQRRAHPDLHLAANDDTLDSQPRQRPGLGHGLQSGDG
jgi:hypothetical protein